MSSRLDPLARIGALRPELVTAVRASAAGGARAVVDPLAALDDNFDAGEADVELRGWTWYGEGSVTSQAIAAGELGLTIDHGGDGVLNGGSFWFNATDGCLLHKAVTGDADVRARVRVRNTADDGLPAPSQFRIAGLAAHDPDRATNLDYVHIGAGSTNQTGNRIEWKTTVASVSTFGDNGVDVAPLDVDLRLVRVGQSFVGSWRPSAGDLGSDDGWLALPEMDRTAAPLPDTLQWGLVLYSNAFGPDIRVFVDAVRFRSQ